MSAALQAFRASVITRLPDDLNGDDKYSIGDLGMMAAYYGKTSEDPNWDLYKKKQIWFRMESSTLRILRHWQERFSVRAADRKT